MPSIISSSSGETTLFVGSYYEQKGSQVTKYYLAGSTRIAMRKYVIPQNMTVEYLLGDHLGSTSLTTDANGALVSELRYKAWGEVRYTWTNAPANTSPAYELVKYQYTGQYSYDAEFGLLFYNARWLDPVTGRFAQADSIIPTSTQGTQAWDRYAFVNNNPVRYTDPTGHTPEECGKDETCDETEEVQGDPPAECSLDPNCITVTQADLNIMVNILTGVQIVEGLGALAFAALGSIAAVGTLVIPPSAGVAVFSFAVAAELTTEVLTETTDSKTYLDTLADSMESTDTIEIRRTPGLIDAYQAEGTTNPIGTALPITRLFMWIMLTDH